VSEGPERDRAIEFLAAKYLHYRDEPPIGPAIIVNIRPMAMLSV
jgi:hypothetical protein